MSAPCTHFDAHHGVAGEPTLRVCDECGTTWSTGPVYLVNDGAIIKTTADAETLWDLEDEGWQRITEAEALGLDDDGTEAEALAPVEVPRSPFAPPADADYSTAGVPVIALEPITDLRPRWSQAGVMSVRGVA